MRYFSRFYKGRQDTITILNRNPLNLYRGPTLLSQHQTIEGAVRAAYRNARQYGNGTYRVRVDGGNYVRFSITLPDRGAMQASTQVGIDVALVLGAPWQPPVVSSTPTPSFTEGTPGTYEFEANITRTGLPVGFDYPITYTLNGTVDPSLSLAAATGILTYDGTAGTTYSLTLTVTDAQGADTSSAFDMTIVAIDTAPVVTTPSFSAFIEGTSSTRDLSAYVTDDGYSPVVYSINGLLPGGVTLAASTGILSYNGIGTPDIRAVTFTATDGVGSDTSGSFNVEVQAGGTITFDGVATPEQIAMYIPATGFSATATATCRYKVKGAQDWITGHDLFRVQPSLAGSGGPTVEDVFAWTIIDLLPNTTYEVEATVTDGSPAVYTLETTTRQLPPTAGGFNKDTSSLTQAQINGLVAGDVIQLNNGTHNIGALTFAATGTEANPIYIRGESRTNTIVQDSGNGVIFELFNMANVIIENMTIQGSAVDGGTGGASRAFNQGSSYSSTNVTIRNITCTGVDRFVNINGGGGLTGMLVYDNTATGNNLWTAEFNSDSKKAWSDDGCRIPGNGCCAFNNTIEGFGDTFSAGSSNAEASGWNTHFYRNKIRNSNDDLIELDDGFRNVTFYDNHSTNSGNFESLDAAYGGPFILARNVVINIYRDKSHKWNGDPTGQFLYNNTFVQGVTLPPPGSVSSERAAWYQPADTTADHYGYRNNVHIYGGAGAKTLWIDDNGHDTLDWSNNAWYPDRRFDVSSLVTASNLANAKLNVNTTTPLFSGKNAFDDDVIVTNQPFETEVVLGADSSTEVTTHYLPRLKNSENAYQTGVEIPNIMDSSHSYNGAAPDMGALPGGVSVPVYGDRSEIPDYLVNASTFQNIVLTGANSPGANETMEDVTPAEWDTFEGNKLRNVVNAWCGGYGTSDGKLYITGGGHTDSANNGLYYYDFIGEAPGGWTLVPNSLSAVADVTSPPATVEVYNDGRPSSVHSYDGLAFDEAGGKFYRWGGSRWYGGGFTSGGWYHNGTNWSTQNEVPDCFDSAPSYTIMDQATRKIMWTGTGFFSFRFYRAATDTWGGSSSIVKTMPGDNPYANLAYDTTRNRVFVFSGNHNRYYDVDWENETVAENTYSPTGQTGQLSGTALGAVYDPVGDVFWISGNGEHTTWTEMDATSPWNCTEHTLTGDAPTFRSTSGGNGSRSAAVYKGFFNRCVWLSDYNAVGFVTNAYDGANIFKVR